jgi:monothiol glutaredoxin
MFLGMKPKPKIIAYLKPWCGWSKGVRAVLEKHGFEYEDRNIIDDPEQRIEMIRKSGQELSPCVEVDGHMLADISGDEVEAWLIANDYAAPKDAASAVPTDRGCSDEEHAAMSQVAPASIRFVPRN